MPFLFWLGGFPYQNGLQKKVGTLVRTSLEDLVKLKAGLRQGVRAISFFGTSQSGDRFKGSRLSIDQLLGKSKGDPCKGRPKGKPQL